MSMTIPMVENGRYEPSLSGAPPGGGGGDHACVCVCVCVSKGDLFFWLQVNEMNEKMSFKM